MGARLRPSLRPLGLAAACVLLASCGTDETDTRAETAGLPSLQQDLEAHEWVLAATGSVGRRPTIDFAEDEVRGSGPCNTFIGDVSVDETSVDISDLRSTSRTCERPVMAAEQEYFSALEAVEEAELDGDEDDPKRLELTGPDVRLAFRAYDAEELLVGAWEIVNVARDGTVESVVAGTAPILTFSDDNGARVTGGCNDGRTSWELDGDLVSFDPVAQTSKACAEPAGVEEQDAAVAAALERAERISITPDSLTIEDAGGSILLVAART